MNSRKGHRFFVGVFRKLSIYFPDRPEYPGVFHSQMLRPFLFSESYHLEIWKGVSNHVQQAKRALVRNWLDHGGMVQNPADSPVHHSKMKRRSAQNLMPVRVVRFQPIVSSAGVKTEIV